MKKILSLITLVLCSLCIFGCDSLSPTKAPTAAPTAAPTTKAPTTVAPTKAPTVAPTIDTGKLTATVVYTPSVEKKAASLAVELGMVSSEASKEDKAAAGAGIMAVVSLAKLSSEDLEECFDLVLAKIETINKIVESESPSEVSSDDFVALVDLYNDLYEVIGPDAIANLLYTLSMTNQPDPEEGFPTIELDYVTVVEEVRFVMPILNAVINSLDKADFDAFLNFALVVDTKEGPSAADVVAMVNIVADMVKAVNDSVEAADWEMQTAKAATELGKILNSEEYKNLISGSTANLPFDIVSMFGPLLDIVAKSGAYVPTLLRFVETVIRQFDEELVTSIIDASSQEGGQTVAIMVVANAAMAAYKELSLADKGNVSGLVDLILENVEVIAKDMLAEMKEAAGSSDEMTEEEFDALIAQCSPDPESPEVTFDQVIAAVDAFLSAENPEESMNVLMVSGLGFLSSKAPNAYILLNFMMMSSGGGSTESTGTPE